MESETPPRHGCLTAYLVFMLFVNTVAGLGFILAGNRELALYPSAPAATPYILGFAYVLNVVIVLFLFWWQKTAFYVFCVLAVLVFLFNLYMGMDSISATIGLLTPLILYGVLQIGGERKAWKYLK
jgi:hypothetical protein